MLTPGPFVRQGSPVPSHMVLVMQVVPREKVLAQRLEHTAVDVVAKAREQVGGDDMGNPVQVVPLM